MCRVILRGDAEAVAIDRRILGLAGPAAVALLTDPLYELTDVAILSTLGSTPLGGAALASRLLGLAYATFIFLTFATTARVARLRGAGRRRDAAETTVTAVWIGTGLGVTLMAILAVLGRPALRALGGRGDVLDAAWVYLRVSIWGLPAFLIVLAGVGHLRGTSNTRTPLYISAAAVTLNLVTEVVLVFGLGFGVGASALSTVIAKWASASVILILIHRERRELGVSWGPRREHFHHLWGVGSALVIRTVALLGTITAAAALAARLGVEALAAHSIVFGIWMFSVFASDGIEVAGQTLIAHHLGDAGGDGSADETRERIVRRLLVWAGTLGLGLAVLLAAVGSPLVSIFTDDPRVAELAVFPMLCLVLLQPVNAVTFAVDGIMVGAAQQARLARWMLLSAMAFTLVVAATSGVGSVEGRLDMVWVALVVFSTVRCGFGTVATLRFAREGAAALRSGGRLSRSC